LFHQPETIIPLTKDTEFTSEYLKYFYPNQVLHVQHNMACVYISKPQTQTWSFDE